MRGQLSIAFLMVLAIVVLLVIIIYPYINEEVENNKVIAEARDGVMHVIGLRGSGFSDINEPFNARVESISMKCNGSSPERCTIYIVVDMPDYLFSNTTFLNSLDRDIRMYARGYVYNAYYGNISLSLSPVITEDRVIYINSTKFK